MKSRFIFLLCLISVMLLGLFARSFYLQYLESDFLNSEGDKKHIKYKNIPASRGTIYDRNGVPLAVSIPVYRLIVDPKTLIKKNNYSQLLSSLSKITSKPAREIDLEIKKRSGKRYFVLKRELRKSEVEIVRRDNFEIMFGLKLSIRGFIQMEKLHHIYWDLLIARAEDKRV